jgi:malonyl CoA-acyl carrier protein transacylase
MSLKFAVVNEAAADFAIATDLADRQLVESIDWLEADQLEHQRTWIAELGGYRTTWKEIKRLSREAGVRAHGHFDGAPGLPDAAAARKAIEFLLTNLPDLHAIVLIRDQDDQPERKGGLEQARQANRHNVVIVIGLAIVERECWVLSGFEPQDEAERQLLDNECKGLGSNPCLQSHELTACKKDSALRSPKRVLKVLAGDNLEREQRCWKDTKLEVIKARGTENGLTDFLSEVQTRLVPLISGHGGKP